MAAFLGIVGQAGEQGFVGDNFGKGVGRVEQVLGKLGRQLRQLFHDGLEARLLVFRQFGAGQAEIAHFVVDDLFLFDGQRGVLGAFAQRLVFLEQLEILAKLGVEARDFRQHLVVRLAPGGDVIDRVQMADDAPGAADMPRPWREAYNGMLPEVSRFYAELGQNLKLFEKYKALRDSPNMRR